MCIIIVFDYVVKIIMVNAIVYKIMEFSLKFSILTDFSRVCRMKWGMGLRVGWVCVGVW